MAACGARAAKRADAVHRRAHDFCFTSVSRLWSGRQLNRRRLSGLVDFVDVDNGERAGPARVVHPGHRIDGLANLCDREAVTRRDHASRSRPAIGLRIVDFVRSEHAAEIVDPTFAAQNVNFSVENGAADETLLASLGGVDDIHAARAHMVERQELQSWRESTSKAM